MFDDGYQILQRKLPTSHDECYLNLTANAHLNSRISSTSSSKPILMCVIKPGYGKKMFEGFYSKRPVVSRRAT